MNAPGADLVVQLEQAAFSRQHERALTTFEALMRHLEARSKEPTDLVFDDDERATVQATRIAGALIAVLTDPRLELTYDWYLKLVPFKRQLQALFDVSGYAGSAMPLRYVSEGVNNVRTPAEEQSQLRKMLLVMGLSDCSEQMLSVIGGLDVDATAPLILSLVASKVVVTERAWAARERLLGMAERLEGASLPPAHLHLLTCAWMQCSYAARPDRHEFKAALNRWLIKSYRQAGLAIPPLKKRPMKKRERPRLVVVAEVLRDGHAMFRCYADRIQQLRRRFETVLVGWETDLDDHARRLVDHVAAFPPGPYQVDRLATHIMRLEPDLVYYPSIGMSPWAVALANLRLAPIQLMSPGHPATSASESIDYILLARKMVGDPEAYTERVVVCGEGRPRQSSYRDVEVPRYRREAEGAPVQIAVPAYCMKLSWPLLRALRAIAERARRRVVWRFFPNETGLIRQHARVVLERSLDHVRVHPRADYAQYMRWLGECQLSVGTFPFAGSNSNVDVLRIGIPRVVLNGREGMERADVNTITRLEGLESLVTESTEALIDRTVALIDDPDARDRLSERIIAQRPERKLLDDQEKGEPFVAAVAFIYDHHGPHLKAGRTVLDPTVEV